MEKIERIKELKVSIKTAQKQLKSLLRQVKKLEKEILNHRERQCEDEGQHRCEDDR